MPGQTLSEIRSLLAGAGLAPRQRYGQNFLIDLNLMQKLVGAADVRPADLVLEVGPGTGSLTEILLKRGARLVAVEIDRGLQALLRERLGKHPRFTLVQADILATKHRINPLVLNILDKQEPGAGGARKLVANLPYQIATPLLMELLYTSPPFERLTCTVQKEVGERLAAEPGSDAYGPVSVISQTLAEIELIAILPPSAFWPRPKVESIMLTIRPRQVDQIDVEDVPDFVDFVQRGFGQRRKMLRRVVRDWELLDALAAFHRAGVNPDARPGELTPEAWRAFHRAVRAQHPPK
ncbi:MAG: 16S rRNA (adenine(1518)-N(6)/adenine(1519)-N(6))-dimethyltransferase RsmA [Phycisphaerae bacterium]